LTIITYFTQIGDGVGMLMIESSILNSWTLEQICMQKGRQIHRFISTETYMYSPKQSLWKHLSASC